MSTAQTPNPTYVQLAEHIRSGKVNATNMATLVDALRDAGAIHSETKVIDRHAAEEDFARTYGREVQIKSGVRPTYLANCKGRLGHLKGSKWQFFPDEGTRAHARNSEWRIPKNAFTPASQIQIEGELEMMAEARIS